MNGQPLDFLDLTIESTGKDTVGPGARFTIALTQSDGAIEPFCGPCVVVDLSSHSQSKDPVGAPQVKDALEQAIARIQQWSDAVSHTPVPEFKRLIIKTKTEDCLHMARLDWTSCLQPLQDKGAVLIGFDGGLNETMVSKISSMRISALVNLNLSGVSGGTTGMLLSGPEKVEGEMMVPCRAVLIYA